MKSTLLFCLTIGLSVLTGHAQNIEKWQLKGDWESLENPGYWTKFTEKTRDTYRGDTKDISQTYRISNDTLYLNDVDDNRKSFYTIKLDEDYQLLYFNGSDKPSFRRTDYETSWTDYILMPLEEYTTNTTAFVYKNDLKTRRDVFIPQGTTVKLYGVKDKFSVVLFHDTVKGRMTSYWVLSETLNEGFPLH